ncbi:DUF4177 domain-containing protein [Phaeobacter gallaeciensis]|uniref:DUF4177 domain-containing protein n=1 Tax=Phaeobacter gallaeciensis TaxID=60890 RepID=UPI00237F4431|nr:DUF4177 domain-containing protein [Phaeobacter gallaeciensis]MDE4095888.1 DUF4177 domain-containing protein [Phaeobacter gallaeciensis]MDE4104699.1 DUF4177 domain-containing protein [Phaeobacter gallaeciensis]MDE4109156.1 DUF4177 domain-containing protein [Phaeobacter gallaeciensis]MDE4113623.1 DUF4177 domain-containing protein [Phaeobacter gallaeciensis]MDE4118091.1 DUF4177 domain-containing protein [Phaeobacter gallaeciensis]
MQPYEYKVVPAPHKGTKAKGVKTPEDRFAHSVEIALNQMAAEGWEYQRAELLPSDERSGLTGSTTNWRNVLIFRRALAPAPVQQAPAEDTAAAAPPLTATAGDPEAPTGATPVPGPGAAQMQGDDGVEELSPVSGVTTALKTRASLSATRDLPEKPTGDPEDDSGTR